MAQTFLKKMQKHNEMEILCESAAQSPNVAGVAGNSEAISKPGASCVIKCGQGRYGNKESRVCVVSALDRNQSFYIFFADCWSVRMH